MHSSLEHASSPFDVKHPVGNFGYPKDTPGYEQVDELADFMSSLQTTLAPHHKPQFAPECCPHHPTTKDVKKDHHKHHGKHHKHHHKHQHEQRDMESLPSFEHRHRRTPMPRRDQHHHDEPKGCPCAAPPPPPPPPSDIKEENVIERFQGPPHSFCPPNVELNATSTVFNFSPEEFSRAALYIGHGFIDSGDVYFTKLGNKKINDIQVKVTVLHGSDSARDKVTLSAFDHDGQYVVEMRRDLPRHQHRDRQPVAGDLCVKYKVEVILPASLESFEEFDLRAKDAHVGSCKGLQTVAFDRFIAGVGRGYLNFGVSHIFFYRCPCCS